MKHAYIGTSGYQYGSSKGTFYPKGLPTREWLSYFPAKFETYQKWYEQTPDNFAFVIKGHRMITQYKKLIDMEESVSEFFDRAKGLREKLQVDLWQFPASFKLTDEHKKGYLKWFETFLMLLPKDIKQAINLRDASWFTSDIYSLIHTYNAALVLSDSPKFPLLPEIDQPFQYNRFHGPERLYASSYSEMQLNKWAEKIKKFQKSCDVYAYFNNDIGGYAVKNARKLEKLV